MSSSAFGYTLLSPSDGIRRLSAAIRTPEYRFCRLDALDERCLTAHYLLRTLLPPARAATPTLGRLAKYRYQMSALDAHGRVEFHLFIHQMSGGPLLLASSVPLGSPRTLGS